MARAVSAVAWQASSLALALLVHTATTTSSRSTTPLPTFSSPRSKSSRAARRRSVSRIVHKLWADPLQSSCRHLCSLSLRLGLTDSCAFTLQITSRLAHINKLEADLKALTSSSATKADLTSGRGEMKKVYDGLHEEVLGLRQRLWGVGEYTWMIASGLELENAQRAYKMAKARAGRGIKEITVLQRTLLTRAAFTATPSRPQRKT